MEFYHLYPSEFQDLLQRDYGNESYIGQGNPASKILIIGKECAAPIIFKDGKKCIVPSLEFIKNADTWKTKSPENIENWVDLPYYMPEKYHPRRPYLGQLLLRNKKNNKGTSVTWKAYQIFINLLVPEDLQVQPRQQLNFYEHCFLTELSTNCIPISEKNETTKESIKQRLGPNGILTHPFFKQFPVVILGVYRYIDWYKDLSIIENFDGGVMNYKYKGIVVSEKEYSQYDEKTKKRLPLYRPNNFFKKGEFINVHESVDGKHVLLHTNHFVDNFHPRSEDWMKELADLVCRYLNR
jgi:hypothetical protein